MAVNKKVNLIIKTSKKLDEQGFYKEADKLTTYLNSRIVVSQVKPLDTLKSLLGTANWQKFSEIVKGTISPLTRTFVPAKILEEVSKYPQIANFVKNVQTSASAGYDQSQGTVLLPKTGFAPLVDVGHAIHPVVETFERGEKGIESVHQVSENLKNTAIITSIKKTAEKALEAIEKFKSTIAGKGLNVAILIADCSSVIHNAEELIEAIHNKEELPIKTAYDLGLRITRIATNQLLWDIVPGLNILNKNPQVRAWVTGINSAAVGMGLLVEGADAVGNIAGSVNPYNAAVKGKMEEPGSQQYTELTVPQIKEQYGEIYNALINVEKGAKPMDAFFQAVPDWDPQRPIKQQIFFATWLKRNQLKQQQAKSKTELYPTANSPYVFSSYKKAKDAQKAEEFARMQRSTGPGLPQK